MDIGTFFPVLGRGSKDTVILKKIEKPSKETLIRELTVIAKEGRGRLEKKGFEESDISISRRI